MLITKEEIIAWLNSKDIRNYTINEDHSVDVNGDVYLNELGLREISAKFGKVSGNFDCSWNILSSLQNCPSEVGGNFMCEHNKLTSLVGAPTIVGDSFECSHNKLTTLHGSPTTVNHDYYCQQNELISLKGSPTSVGGGFYCFRNKLISLEGAPKFVGSTFSCYGNQLTSLHGGPETVGGEFDCQCEKDGIKNLEGAPLEIGGKLTIQGNFKEFSAHYFEESDSTCVPADDYNAYMKANAEKQSLSAIVSIPQKSQTQLPEVQKRRFKI